MSVVIPICPTVVAMLATHHPPRRPRPFSVVSADCSPPPFQVVSADPPWKFSDSLPGKSRGASKLYPCLPTWQICRFPLPPIADDAILFLWRLAAMQLDALEVAKAWGFTVKSEIVWEKLTKRGKPWIGMGRYVRASHETALVCTRGRYKVRDRGVRSRFAAPVPTYQEGDPEIGKVIGKNKRGEPIVRNVGDYIHSAKPAFFYTDIVERMCRGPYCEMFARESRHGWSSFGNEVDARGTALQADA